MGLKTLTLLVALVTLYGVDASEQGTGAARKLAFSVTTNKLFNGMTLSPYIKKQQGDSTPYPFTCMNSEYTDKSLTAILPYTNRIRLYSAVCVEANTQIMVRSAIEGFEIFAGLYGSGDIGAFNNEVGMFNTAYNNALKITKGKKPFINAISVANEAVLANSIKVSQIRTLVDIARKNVQISPMPPIAIVDVPQVFDFYRQIFQFVDIIGVNIHPLYSGKCKSLESCIKNVDAIFKRLNQISKEEASKHNIPAPHVTITETGFSYNTIISKDNIKGIQGGITNQGGYDFVNSYINVFLPEFKKYDYYWFESIISDWKAVPQNEVEFGWGLIDRYMFQTRLNLKPDFSKRATYYASPSEVSNVKFGGYAHLNPISYAPQDLFDFTKENGGPQYFDPNVYQANLFKPE